MGVDDFAECELTAHPEVGLMFGQHRRWSPHWVDFTVLLWLIQRTDKITWIQMRPLIQYVNIQQLKPQQLSKQSEEVSPKTSLRYLCPMSLRYSSMALVARVFSLKIRCSRSINLSTSHIAMSERKSWCRVKEETSVSLQNDLHIIKHSELPCLLSTCGDSPNHDRTK